MQLRKFSTLHALSLLLILALALAACTATPTGDAAPEADADMADATDSDAADSSEEAASRRRHHGAHHLLAGRLHPESRTSPPAPKTSTPPALRWSRWPSLTTIGDLEPRLASGNSHRWKTAAWSEDLTSITWTLRDDVLWSDGSPFTAADVVFTYNYCVNPDTGCGSLSRFEGVESVEAVDELHGAGDLYGTQSLPLRPLHQRPGRHPERDPVCGVHWRGGAELQRRKSESARHRPLRHRRVCGGRCGDVQQERELPQRG